MRQSKKREDLKKARRLFAALQAVDVNSPTSNGRFR